MNLKDYLLAKKNILSIYFTAGFPTLNSTVDVILQLQEAGVDLVEVGVPYSDSLVDGPTIQVSNEIALKNGITLKQIFEDLNKSKEKIKIPLVLMSSYNPVLQFGKSNFIKACVDANISSLIIPDMPIEEFLNNYKDELQKNNIGFSFLITSRTSDERIQYLDSLSSGFLYAVSQDATTGNEFILDDSRKEFFSRLKNLNLANPFLIGFGIKNKETFELACTQAKGAIIGSEFIRFLNKNSDISKINEFVKGIRLLS